MEDERIHSSWRIDQDRFASTSLREVLWRPRDGDEGAGGLAGRRALRVLAVIVVRDVNGVRNIPCGGSTGRPCPAAAVSLSQ